MKNQVIALLAAMAVTGIANAQNVTNLFPNGDFAAGGPTADWVEVSGGGTFTFSYPTSGGHPGNYGVIDNTAGGGWGIWVGGNDTALPLETLGLTAGNSYSFVQDMKILSGTDIGGLKIESWGPSGKISDSGDMPPMTNGHNTAVWETYSFTYQVAFGATGLKIVPLWGVNSSVAYDNFGVVVPLSSPLTTAITFPANGATVNTNFTISASASVAPATITNVSFYLGATLLGSDDTGPYSLSVTGAPVGPAVLKVIAQDSAGNSATSAVVNVTVSPSVVENIFKVDPSAGWAGYMNWYFRPQEGGAWQNGSAWGVDSLSAAFSGVGPASVLTLKPAPLNDTNSYWYDYTVDPLLTDPTNFVGAVGFKDMEANMYVQLADGTVSGNVVTFTGTCISNTLDIRLNPGSTNLIGNGWTNYAFVKDLAPDYSSSVESHVMLTNGGPFGVSLQTIGDPSRHVQYGFVTRGPNVWPTDVNNYGAVQIQSLDASPTNVYVNSSANWVGFMNVFSQDGTAYQFGSGWGTADLVATFGGFGLTLAPNTIGDPDPYWYTPSGGPGAVGNKTMDASLYVEFPTNTMAGRKLIFSGNVLSNTLVSASNTNALGKGWTCVAFIKDFATNYSTFNSITVPLTPGAFSISLNTVNDPNRHVQYGFETVGPDVWVTDVAPFGNVLIGNVGVLPTIITASKSGPNINLSFASQTGKSYTVQYKNDLTTGTWNTLTTTNGTGINIVIPDAIGVGPRFYRLSVQ